MTDLPAGEITTFAGRGTLVTTPDRTAADLLRWLPPFMALAVADCMAGRELISVQRVAAILDRWDGREIYRPRHGLLGAHARA